MSKKYNHVTSDQYASWMRDGAIKLGKQMAREARGDKITDATGGNGTDGRTMFNTSYQALKRNEIRKGAADELYANHLTYWTGITPSQPQKLDKPITWKPEDDERRRKEDLLPANENSTYATYSDGYNRHDYNDDEHWISAPPTNNTSTTKTVDLDADDKKGDK